MCPALRSSISSPVLLTLCYTLNCVPKMRLRSWPQHPCMWPDVETRSLPTIKVRWSHQDGPYSIMAMSLQRGGIWTQTRRMGRRHVKTKAVIRVTLLEAEELLKIASTAPGAWNRFSLSPRKEPALPSPWTWTSSPQIMREQISAVSHPACSTLS